MVSGSGLNRLTVDDGYPNPATSSIRFDYVAPYSETMTLTVVDLLGKTVGTSNSRVSKGDGNVTISLSGTRPGSYYCIFDLFGDRIMKHIEVK